MNDVTTADGLIAGTLSLADLTAADPHLTLLWSDTAVGPVTFHSLRLELYPDGRWVSSVKLSNVSHMSNFDVTIGIYWMFETGHRLESPPFLVLDTNINHKKDHQPRVEARRLSWLVPNYDVIQNPNLTAHAHFLVKRNN